MSDPITREEAFLKAIAEGSEPLEPVTRREMFLAKMAGQNTETPTPITREEMFLARAAENAGSGGSGGSSVSPKAVNFYDYDGTCLYAYTVEEAQALSELPALPERSGLICQGWNYDLETIKSHNRAVDVGATYITDDGTTRIYIHLEDGRTSPMLGVCPNGTVTVDWGDGTTPNTLTGTSTNTVQWTPTHEYAKAGNYVITLTVDGNMAFKGSSNMNGGSYILRCDSETNSANPTYQSAVKKIEIGSNASIGYNAFYACYSLKSVVIPDGVTTIDGYAFYSCYSLKSVVIPDGVTIIDDYAFCYCHSLESVVIPNSVTSTDDNAFSRCYTLKSVVIPDGLTTIDKYTFEYCYTLKSVVIPNTVTRIYGYTFSSCYSLSSVVIPNSVTIIDGGAFNFCKGVNYFDFTSHTAVPTLSGTAAFNNNADDFEIRVPAALYDEWIAATNWSTYASKIVAV